MNLLASAIERRRAEQVAFAFRAPHATRVVCACGCGRWWYRAEVGPNGRPVKYATDECRAVVKARRRARGTP